jgi:phage FluMu protein Com
MPYLRCPKCGMLAHTASDAAVAITCPRCRALHQRVLLAPVEESLRLAPTSLEQPAKPPG